MRALFLVTLSIALAGCGRMNAAREREDAARAEKERARLKQALKEPGVAPANGRDKWTHKDLVEHRDQDKAYLDKIRRALP